MTSNGRKVVFFLNQLLLGLRKVLRLCITNFKKNVSASFENFIKYLLFSVKTSSPYYCL